MTTTETPRDALGEVARLLDEAREAGGTSRDVAELLVWALRDATDDSDTPWAERLADGLARQIGGNPND